MIKMKLKMKSTNSVFKLQTAFLLAILLFGVISCAKKPVTGPAIVYSDDIKNYTSEVNIDSKISSDSYVLVTNGEGNSLEDATNQAEKNAFSVLLFNGIPNSDLNYPLVENERESYRAHEAFYENFFKKYDFRKFIIQHSIISQSPSRENRINVKMRITINLGALKTYLIQNSITRKFGL